MDLKVFADAVMIPLGTLKDWLGAGEDDDASGVPEGADSDSDADAADTTSASAMVLVVLSCWDTWRGSFGAFCKHVREEQRVPFGRSLISDTLLVDGKRRPQRRSGRSPDERALRGAFETVFGGAQWVGDGVLRFVDLALAAERRVDRLFWLLAVADEINAHAKSDPAPLVAAAARRAHCTHRVTYRERQDAVRVIVANVVPLS